MRSISVLVALALAVPVAFSQGPAWETLFDGSSTDAWRGYKKDGFPQKGWVVEDGALKVQARGRGGDIITKKQYRDFDFRFEWKVAPGANSGIMYRVTETEGPSWRTGPEYQILDDSKHRDGRNTKTSAASLYALYAAKGKVLKPVGEYNTGRIVLRGSFLEHWVNGTRVVSCDLASDEYKQLVASSKFRTMPNFGKRPAGHICLQYHGDDVWFRNMRVLDLSEAREVDLFNGRDLSGWTYFLRRDGKMSDVWSVVDGAIVCKGRPAGYIRTTEKFDNFLLRVSWRWPEGGKPGNSGVLIRQVGEDKVWPKSIEAQLMHGNAGDFWNIGKFDMKVDASRTKGRNTKKTAMNERPVGQWNTYEILCCGGEVELVVNGKVLNRAWDCAEVKGAICLQSEGAEIHFKDVTLIPLSTSK